jgi:acetylglutamate/LysW-gamma-L-alpha-aminoadipate kinase
VVIVLKLGGSLMKNGISESFTKDFSSNKDDEYVIVHGGGPTVTDLCKRLNMEAKFITSPSGIRSRYTDAQTMQTYIMSMRGSINASIVLALQKAGMKSFGMSGIDGPTIIAERKKRLIAMNEKGRKMFIDGGYTGKILSVNGTFIKYLFSEKITPVVAPIAVGLEHEPLNVDGDRAASAISGELKATKMILLTDVDGIIFNGKLVEKLNMKQAVKMLRLVGNGMDKKIMAAIESIEAGTNEVIIANGNRPMPISAAINTNIRTVITK